MRGNFGKIQAMDFFRKCIYLCLAVTVLVAVTPSGARTAEYEVVGVLAYAVEPDVARELGLTQNQLSQLNDIVNEAEAEILTYLSDLRNLPPQQREAALTEVRGKVEERGLTVLSVQQRAKLEQIRLKRLGPSFFTDPVVARRLGLTEAQKQTLAQALAQKGTGSTAPDQAGAATAVLDDSQRKALRAMLLGEIVGVSGSDAPQSVGQDVVGTPRAGVGGGPSDPDDELTPEEGEDIGEFNSSDGADPLPNDTPVETVPSAQSPLDQEEPPYGGPPAQPSEGLNPQESGGKWDSASTAPSKEGEEIDQAASSEGDATDHKDLKSSHQEDKLESHDSGGSTPPAMATPGENENRQKESGTEPSAVTAGPQGPAPVPAAASAGTVSSGPPQAGTAVGTNSDQSGKADSPGPIPVQSPSQDGVPAGAVVPKPSSSGSTEGAAPSTSPLSNEAASTPSSRGGQPQASDRTAESPVVSSAPKDGVRPLNHSSPPSPSAPPSATTGTTAQAGESIPALPPADVKLRFNFRYQPWKTVLEWLAQQAGLSLVMEAPPPGTFNYVDDHEFTPAQAIDLLNSVLLTKGYVLVRRERMLMLLNVEDGVPPNLVDRVSPEDLDSRGDYEMVSCLFQLRRMTPEEAEQEVKKLLGPQGTVVVLTKAKQLLVTETAGRLKTIRRMIDAIENPDAGSSTVRTFRINPMTIDQVLSIVRQMFQIPADQTATPDGSLRFAIDPSGTKILVTGTPDLLDKFAEVLKALDPSAESPGSLLESTPQLEVYPITSADPQMVLQVLQTLLAGMPDVRLAIDPRTGALVAWARPAQHATIRATLQQMQGEVGQVEVIPLRVVDPQLAVLAISKLFGGGDSASTNAPTVDADITTRMLLVRGTRAQIEQIKQLLVKMGEPAGDGQAGNLSLMRTIPMDAATAQAVLEQMQNIWPQFRQNRLQIIRSVVPSEGSPTGSQENQGSEQSNPTDTTGPSASLQSTRIPIPLASLTSRRLVLGLNNRSTSSATTSSSGSSTSATPQPSQPQPSPAGGQPPFFQPWGRPGGWGPPGGFFDRGRGWDRGSSGGEGDRRSFWRSTSWELEKNAGNHLATNSETGSFVGLSDPHTPRSMISFISYAQPAQDTGSSARDAFQASAPPAAAPAAADAVQPAIGSTPQGGEQVMATADASEERPTASETSTAPSPGASQPGAGAATSGPQQQTPPVSAPIIVAVTPEGLIIASQDPEALNQFESLVRRMVSQGSAQYQQAVPELVVYYLKHARAESVASILDQILGGGTLTTTGSTGGSLIGEIARAAFGELGGGLVGSLLGADTGTSSSSSSSSRTSSRIQITPDARLNALIVQAYPQDLQLIEEILRVLDQADSPEDVAVQPKTIIIPVKNTQAEEIAQILRSVYQDRLVTGGGANRPPSPQEIIQLLRGGRGGPGGRTQPQEEQQRMSIGVDVRTNSLIVSAPEKLLNEVKQLVEQLDQKAVTESEETTQVVTLQKASPESVRAALSALLGSGVQIRGSTSSGTRSSSTPSSPPTSTPFRGSSGGTFPFQGGSFRGFGQTSFGGFTPSFGGFGGRGTSGTSGTSGRTSGRGR